ncbi:acyloxyacyl hydrolase [Geomonas sp. RF6]|uniref:acyloxyacyl hydrolase n=1 Tax=Geomonas sp. RF6 TaxID=2897342 RepID=UPI001E4075E1|nr:acyloxyacyl hydrolase [Geomonas sp. RF6]UFS72013.1 acyloxyacyl hydrolase [Geomonas sp. RF6]
MRISSILAFSALIAAFPLALSAHADPGWKMAGVRAGLSATSHYTYYHEYEAFTVFETPLSWRSAGGWGLTTRVEGSAGALHSQGVDAFIGMVGPDFAVDKKGIPLELNAGLNLAFLSTAHFGRDNFEGNLQFASHIGVNFRFTDLLGIGYRFQHMSNGNLYGGNNQGLNLHMASLIFYLD